MMMKPALFAPKLIRRSFLLVGLLMAALIANVMLAQSLRAAGTISNLSESQKNVDQTVAEPEDTLVYTIFITNTALSGMVPVTMTDILPEGLIYMDHTFNDPINGIVVTSVYTSGVLTWTGQLGGNGYVEIELVAQVAPDFPLGDSITNTAVVLGLDEAYSLTAVTLITYTPVVTHYAYMPLIQKPLPTPTLGATKPNSNNEWTLSWSGAGTGLTGYEVQEAQNPDFAGANIYTHNPDIVSQMIQKPLTWNNVYYYRVRSLAGGVASAWSNTVVVIGGYRDDFTDSDSGWAVRRTSYYDTENVSLVWYGDEAEPNSLIILMDDRWDWMLVSPLRPAPKLPYVIEYRSRVHNPVNLASGGIVYGGDWNSGACPDLSNVYETTNCFNQFYTHNYVWYGPIKLLFEQVNELIWCPTCGGALLKRIADLFDAGNIHDDGEPALQYHTYRVEVRETGSRVYVNDAFMGHFPENAWISNDRPYFGVFASTDEYKPSIWFFEYYQVTPLD